MTYFLKQGSSYLPTPEANLDVHEVLPVGTYTVKMNPMTNQFYFEVIGDLDITGKLYGDITKQCNRIMSTFDSRSSSTGVMLAGEKGSGKTLLAKLLSIASRQKDIPTVVVNEAWKGEQFNQLIQGIQQPCVVIFDEFEKVYDREDQEAILTLLDGVYPSKKLFILTCNNKWAVDEHMRNRPGRIFYMLDFDGLNVEFIREYCEDNLKNKEHIDTICKVSTLFRAFNFDMLKALVEEMNRYDESPHEAMQMLNAKPASEKCEHSIQVFVGGKEVCAANKNGYIYPDDINQHPLGLESFLITWYTEDDDEENQAWTIRPQHLARIDTDANTLTYIPEKDVKVVFTRVIQKGGDYWRAL